MRIGVCVVLFWIFMASLSARAFLQITVRTDQPVYQLGEPVTFSITVYNSGPGTFTLTGAGVYTREDGSYGLMITDYRLDDRYLWSDGLTGGGAGLVWAMEFGPGQSRTWDMVHGAEHMQNYPLDAGTHFVVALAGSTLQSLPVSFLVVPEPATIFLLGLGAIGAGRKRDLLFNCHR